MQPLIVSELSHRALRRALAGPGLRLRTGPVVTVLHSHLDGVWRGIRLHYANHPIEPETGFADFHVRIDRPGTLRRWIRPQVAFEFDGTQPFAPLPCSQGFAMLEWGMNWCVSAHCHQFLMLHAGVVARDGRALVLPAPSGSGKSTLTAGLALRGWRLLSDELALIDLRTGRIVPLPRPISLKNASIDVIRAFAPAAVFGPVVHDTTKGDVAHLQPPPQAVRTAFEDAAPTWIALPRYVADTPPRLAPLSKGRALMHLVENAFNYNIHGRHAFATLSDLVDRVQCHEFTYGRLDDAIACFDALAQRPAHGHGTD